MEQMRERVARALCELHIRNVRRHDTSLPELEAMLPGCVDYAWQDFLPQADAALSLMQSEIDQRNARQETLFEAIAHGDDEHRAWLKKAIDDHFAGRPVEAARGKGGREPEIDRRVAEEKAALLERLREDSLAEYCPICHKERAG